MISESEKIKIEGNKLKRRETMLNRESRLFNFTYLKVRLQVFLFLLIFCFIYNAKVTFAQRCREVIEPTKIERQSDIKEAIKEVSAMKKVVDEILKDRNTSLDSAATKLEKGSKKLSDFYYDPNNYVPLRCAEVRDAYGRYAKKYFKVHGLKAK